jgi:hypothetical protein
LSQNVTWEKGFNEAQKMSRILTKDYFLHLSMPEKSAKLKMDLTCFALEDNREKDCKSQTQDFDQVVQCCKL